MRPAYVSALLSEGNTLVAVAARHPSTMTHITDESVFWLLCYIAKKQKVLSLQSYSKLQTLLCFRLHNRISGSAGAAYNVSP